MQSGNCRLGRKTHHLKSVFATPSPVAAQATQAGQAACALLRASAVVVAGATALWCAPGAALASAPDTLAQAPAPTQRYSIAAGPLSRVITQLSVQGGIQIAGASAQAQGVQSPGVQGEYTASSALNAALAGTGFHAIAQAGGGYILSQERQHSASAQPPAAAAVAGPGMLPEVVVSAAFDGATEASDSYTQSLPITAATGLRMTQQQTPQSVSVITRQEIDDFQLSTLQDIGKVTPGIYFKNNGVSDQEAQAYARGFAINQLNVDGQAMTTTDFNGRAIGTDLAMYDSVEVVRGATGLLQGVGQPSGSINLVRKRPTATPMLNVTASLGSWSDKRLTVDASRALNAAGNLRARVVASGQDSDSFVDVAHDRNGLLYGVVELDITPATLLAAGASVQRTRTEGVFRGLPSYPDGRHMGFSRSTFLDVADSFQHRDTDIAFAELRHRFDNDWSVKATYTYTDGSSNARYSNNSRIEGSERTLTSGETGWKYTTRQHNFDVRANGAFELLGRSHELVLGANVRKDNMSWKEMWEGTGDGRIVDVDHWDPHAHRFTGGAPEEGLNQKRRTTEKGVFAAGNFALADPLHLVLGGRFSWYKEEGSGGWYTGVQPAWRQSLHESKVFVPYVGLVYDINPQNAVYASVTEIFSPQNAQDVNGRTLDPIKGTNYEVGLKGEYFEGALNTSVAVFRMNQRNRAVADNENCPTSGLVSCSRAAGEVQSQGVELQVSGAMTPAWQMSAGYTYARAKYTKDDVASNVGQRTSTDEPRHLFKLASSYRLPGTLNQWALLGSVVGQSKIYTDSPGYYTSQGSYFIVGLGATYRINQKMNVQLNIDNVFDRKYYSGLGADWNGAGERYGRPRSVSLTGRYTF